MSQITLSYAMQNAQTTEAVVKLINEGSCEGMERIEFSSYELAGQYAFDAAESSGYKVDRASIEAHLEIIEEAGAVFDMSKAIRHAENILKIEYSEKLKEAIELAKQEFIHFYTYTTNDENNGKMFGEPNQFNVKINKYGEISCEFEEKESCWSEGYMTYASGDEAKKIYETCDPNLVDLSEFYNHS